MKTKLLVLFTTVATLAQVTGAPLNNAGNITATQNSFVKATTDVIAENSVKAETGYVKAQTYFFTPGYLQVNAHGTIGTTLLVGSTITSNAGITGNAYLTTNGWFSAAGDGYFGNFLRIGGNTNTPAAKSVQIGLNAKATSYGSLVVGQYNVEEGTAGSWQFDTPTVKEPLFVAGNGVDANNKRNAFAVYKDGTVTMSKAQGDISMGQFGN